MNVKKLLKRNSSAILPSESVKNRITSDCGTVTEEAVRSGNAVAKKRKTAISLAAVGMAVVAALTATLICLNPVSSSPVPDVIKFGSISSATDFYACSAVSVGNMLAESEENLAATETVSASSYAFTATPVSKITVEQKEIVGKYAVFATGFLGDGKITSTRTVAEKEGYGYKLGVGYSDGFGVSDDKILYYNEIKNGENQKGEEEYSIVGELVSGGVSYPISGKYECESDGSESESETEFVVYTSSDRLSYIAVEYEREVNSATGEVESEFVVSVYKNGRLAEKATVNGEVGDDGYAVDVLFGEGSVKLKFNRDEQDGKKLMGVHASFDDDDHKLIMRPQDEYYDEFDFIDYEDWDDEDWDFDDWDFDFGDWGKNDGGWYDHGDWHGDKNEGGFWH